MKKLLAVALIATMVTGCAAPSPNEPSLGSKVLCGYGVCTDEVRTWANNKVFNGAKQDCQRMGHKEGTGQFSQCVQTLVENERTRVANQNAANQIAHQNFMNSPATNSTTNNSYRNYDCQRRIGGRVECTGY